MGDNNTKEDSTTKQKIVPPRMFKVVILNDDFTPQDFVVDVLISIFRKAAPEAFAIMMQVHTSGSGIAGVYTRDIAETKLEKAKQLAQSSGHPLALTMSAE